MNLKSIYDRKAELFNTIRNIQHRMHQDERPMTPAEYKQFTQAGNEIEELNMKIKTFEGQESSYNATNNNPARIVERALMDSIKATVTGKLRGFDRDFLRTTISATTTDTAFGGHAVPDATLNQVFFEALSVTDFLAEMTVIDIAGAGSTKVPKIERGNGPTVEGRADETTQLVGSTLQFTANTFTPRDIFILTRNSNSLIRAGIPVTGQAILQACRRELRQHLAQCVLSGDATNPGEFTGLDNYAGVPTVDAGSAALTNWNPIIDAYESLLSKNVNKQNIAAVVSPAVWSQIARFTCSDNHPINMPKELEGMRMIVSSAVADTYGAGSDESRIYIGDWSQMFLGVSGNFEMTLNERFADFDMTGLLLLTRADMQIYDEEAMTIITNIALT